MFKEEKNLRKRLIQEGIKIVQKEGMKNISLRRVAELCGVTHSTPYRHFKNKNDYLKVLVEQMSIIFGTSMAKEIDESMSGREMLLQMGMNFVGFAQEYPNFFDVLFLGDYIVQTKVVNHNLTADQFLPGFEEFQAVVEKMSSENNLEVKKDIEEVQLWSFIIGFALIVGKNDIASVNAKWASTVIDQMINSYIQGTRKKE